MSAQDHLQLVAGILGFFALMAFVAAVAGIVRGEPSMMASAVLVGLLAALWFVVRRIRA
ncbi:hypothetical protein HQ346_09125 [Rhodococcus sp. BP-252]|uniref:hypothetical protein n=1 Tax=Nocardiaceae TaxID=85025 RepID=UPI000B295D48|nr:MULTISPECIES: hypothetical protein [Rhodococcus]MBY6411991.1 hypothetical protein [Rhodococcus sp. BP-320]MBY6416381.1 hypothetical protein [Rhodococcus sp. BP-321]MBY6420813.1 hypothetical protein [Rhodococcus sp. BP-324]MBY6426405.1 hypothetical protein [Rhodococcus sp. BP-323]MBY6431404.1 hypothetical protein [Rhodococcus sp. BP-322]